MPGTCPDTDRNVSSQSAIIVLKMIFFMMHVILLFFFSLHRNSPTFKSFEEKVENLKASSTDWSSCDLCLGVLAVSQSFVTVLLSKSN